MINKHTRFKPTIKESRREAFETSYLISNQQETARYYLDLKRNHWSIEAFHYIKDVTYKEDSSKITRLNSPQNHSFFKSLVITIYKSLGFTNQAQAIRLHCNNIPVLFRMLMAFGR